MTLADWRRSLQLRLLLGTLVWIIGTVVVSGWALSGLFRDHVQRQLVSELETHLNQLAARLQINDTGEPEVLGDLSDPRLTKPFSGLYWQIDGIAIGESPVIHQRGWLRARSLWDGVLQLPEDHLGDGAIHTHRIQGPDGSDLLAIERMLTLADRPDKPLRLIVAANATLIDVPLRRFNGLLATTLGLLAFGLVAAAIVQVRTGLRPLDQLRRDLGAVRAGRVRQLEGRYPSELQPLVSEFNGVLVRNAEVVERARTHAGNLAHALKTPLSVLANAAGSHHGPLAELVSEQVTLARTQVDRHLARARSAASAGIPGQQTPLQPALEGLLRVMQKVHADRSLSIELVPIQTGLCFRGECQDLQEMLGNLLDNACKWARARICIRTHLDHGQILISVDDDGDGLSESARKQVLVRGIRLDERQPGSGLGLAIVSELAELYGGTLELGRSPLGGLCATLKLPLAG